jgi:hypothetical protein
LVQRPQSAEPPALSAIIAMAEPCWVALLRLAEARAALLLDGADDAAITAAMQAAVAVMPGVADDAAAPLCSLYAAVLRCGDAALSAQAESHLRYALARMPDLPVPPELGPLQPADAIFTPGTVLHLRMRCEASANLLMLLERGCETGLPALTEPS